MTTGCGTVFELTSDGSEAILHGFSDPRSDGAYPGGTLVLDKSGNIYGLTAAGGSDADCGMGSDGCGVLFKFAGGAVTVLHGFSGGSDGAYPVGSLLVDTSGNVFGTTAGGGSKKNCGLGGEYGCGTVFEVSSGGKETVLHAFRGGRNDGAYPTSGLVAVKDSFYGTTAIGSTGCGKARCGTAYEVKE